MQSGAEKGKTAIIIGAGPAGLTAALELLRRTDIRPIVLEQSSEIGGISRTVRFGENRMDIGGHRFFSKSDTVIDWWLEILPLEESVNEGLELTYQNKKHTIASTNTHTQDSEQVMLVRRRKSRIFFDGKFYEYPITLSFQTLKNLGIAKIIKIALTYARSIVAPRKEETLEDFYINRFGSELYETFFKAYTEKVWGLPCDQLSANWGRQRVKGLSVWKTISNSIARLFRKATLGQKHTETSLIEYFLYPKYGPGHLWETVAKKIEAEGGVIIRNAQVDALEHDHTRISSVSYTNTQTGETHRLEAGYVFSTMPIDELFASFTVQAPPDVQRVAQALQFRDFLTVGLLLKDAQLEALRDNWIYVHDPSVQVGRIQLFHNWSPHLVPHENTYLLGFEYFCSEHDALWQKNEAEISAVAKDELAQIGIAQGTVLGSHVEKVPKAYPVYTGTYEDLARVREYLNGIENFFPIGRNGMHRYNNQDHSMLTAMASVAVILGEKRKEEVWEVNTEQAYHEEK